MKFGGQPTPWSDEQIDGLRCRTVAQTLIEEIGADGPESAEDAAKRAVNVIQRQRDRIAALEAEKAERERQEPVAWAWDDALGCMHVHCGSRRPVWVDGECSDATRAEMKLRPLYARPLPARSDRDCAHYTFVGWLCPRGIFIEDEIYQAWKGHRKDPSAAQYRKVYAAPPIQRQDPSPVPHVDPDWLANVIRRSDQRMTMTSDELAEKIADAINGRAK